MSTWSTPHTLHIDYVLCAVICDKTNFSLDDKTWEAYHLHGVCCLQCRTQTATDWHATCESLEYKVIDTMHGCLLVGRVAFWFAHGRKAPSLSHHCLSAETVISVFLLGLLRSASHTLLAGLLTMGLRKTTIMVYTYHHPQHIILHVSMVIRLTRHPESPGRVSWLALGICAK